MLQNKTGFSLRDKAVEIHRLSSRPLGWLEKKSKGLDAKAPYRIDEVGRVYRVCTLKPVTG